MRKIFTLLCCCLLTLCVGAQTDINRVDKNGKKQGPWKKYEKGVLVYEGQFENDVPKGTFKYYFPNGKIKSITEFISGVSKVQVVTYHENGNKASEGVFVDQQKDGLWKYYSDKNVLLSEENYKLGKKNGRFVTYSVDGYKLKEENYLNDELDGECKAYFEKEELSTVMNFLKGMQNGETIAYYPGGKVSLKGMYHNNLKIGEWLTYDEQGNLRKTEEYDKNGHLAKIYYHFYNNGNPQKLNKDLIAYFQKNGDAKTTIILKNGNHISATESFMNILQWVDLLEFVKITPKLYASINCIKSYKDVDANTVIVKLSPSLGYEVTAQEEDAKFVRSLFVTEMPKEE